MRVQQHMLMPLRNPQHFLKSSPRKLLSRVIGKFRIRPCGTSAASAYIIWQDGRPQINAFCFAIS